MSYSLTTTRLQLTPFVLEDKVLFLNMNIDPYVRKYLWDDEIIDKRAATEILVQNQKHFQEDQYGLWKINLKNDDQVIGYVGLWYFFDEPQPQLIYALLEPYTKRGFALEAAKSIIDYAFERLDFNYLIAATDEAHQASQNVALSLGMRLFETRTKNGKPTLFYRIEKC